MTKEDIAAIFDFFDRLRISGSEADKLVALKDKLKQSVLPQEVEPVKTPIVKENGQIKLGAVARPTAQQLRKKGTTEEAGDKEMEKTLEDILPDTPK